MMMKLPTIRPLDSKITDYFASADQNLSIPLIQVPTEEGLSLPYLCPSLTSPDGILFAGLVGGHYVLLHQFMKKTQKTPAKEIEKAKKELAYFKERSGLR